MTAAQQKPHFSQHWIRRKLGLRIPLEVAASGSLSVRIERVHLGLAQPLRILYASDLHLGWPWTNGVARELISAAHHAIPDLILLGGDLVDRRSGLQRLQSCTATLAKLAPVIAVAGNHDRRPGIDAVRRALRAGGAVWLTDHSAGYSFRDILLSADALTHPPRGSRGVLCTHDPAIFPAAASAGYALVLAGHLPGGQGVLATVRGRHYPGAWFARWTGSRFSQNGAEMIVSNGARDTLPLRWNCPREVIVCQIT